MRVDCPMRQQLSVFEKELNTYREYTSRLERERQHLCTKLRVKPHPMLGFEDARGGGTPMMLHPCRMFPNERASRPSIFRIRSVSFELFEVMAQNEADECDLLLPSVSVVLGASSEESSKSKKALNPDTTSSPLDVFRFWQR